MPAYIDVREWEHEPTCETPDDCNPAEYPAHHVRVYIGSAILDPFYKLMQNLAELHDENMEREGGMTKHRREEPKCEYCATIKAAQKTWKGINGRPL